MNEYRLTVLCTLTLVFLELESRHIKSLLLPSRLVARSVSDFNIRPLILPSLCRRSSTESGLNPTKSTLECTVDTVSRLTAVNSVYG